MRTRSKKPNESTEAVKSSTQTPVWQSVEKIGVPMDLNVSVNRKSRRISNVKNKDIYDISLSISPRKEDTKKIKVQRAPKTKVKHVAKASFKQITLTTDKCWQNPLTIPSSIFYRKIDNSSTVSQNISTINHTADNEDLSHDDAGYDASVSMDDEESCFSLPSVSTLIPKGVSQKNTLFKITSTPYGSRTYGRPSKPTEEEDFQMCFGFEEPEKDSLLLSPVERPKTVGAAQPSVTSCWESDTDHEACPTRVTTKISPNPNVLMMQTVAKPEKVNIPKKLSEKSRKTTKVPKKCKVPKNTTHVPQENAKKIKPHKKSLTKPARIRKPLKDITGNAIKKKEAKNAEKSMLDDWASDINSHFSEIDEMELFVE